MSSGAYLRNWLGRLFEGWVRDPLLYLFDSCVSLSLARSDRIPPRIAFVRLDAIGDFILWLDAARLALQGYPAESTILIANPQWAEYARQLGYWHQVLAVDPTRFRSDLRYRAAVIRQIHAARAGTLVNPVVSRRFAVDDAIARLSGAQVRIGWQGDATNLYRWQKPLSDRCYTHCISPPRMPQTERERNLEFALRLPALIGGDTATTAKMTPVHLPLPQLVTPLDLAARSAPFIAVAPGASWTGKTWPVPRFAELVGWLTERTGWDIVVLGSPQEQPAGEELLKMTAKPGVNLAGKLALAESIEYIRQAELVIANDSAAIHIAAAVHTPSLCILGGGHYGRFLPYQYAADRDCPLPPVTVVYAMPCFNCDWRCTQPHDPMGAMPCIGNIGVEQAKIALTHLLKTRLGLELPAKGNRF